LSQELNWLFQQVNLLKTKQYEDKCSNTIVYSYLNYTKTSNMEI